MLTLKDFTRGSCIRDILLHMSYAKRHAARFPHSHKNLQGLCLDQKIYVMPKKKIHAGPLFSVVFSKFLSH